MKKHDSLLSALREVRELTKNLFAHEKVYLAIDYWGESYYVAVNDYDIEWEISKDFRENRCDASLESVANDWKVIEYSLAKRKDAFPYLYEKAVKPKFSNGTDLIRKHLNVEPEYSVDFNIVS